MIISLILATVDDQLAIYRILGECLLISSLPGKALRTFVDIARPGKLDIKRREPGIVGQICEKIVHFMIKA